MRDAIECLVAAGVATWLLWKGWTATVAWPWLTAACLALGVSAVFLREIVRRRRIAVHQAPGLRQRLEGALREADHQIAQLRAVVWWYLLPLAAVAVLILVGTSLDAQTTMAPEVWARVRRGVVAVMTPVLTITFGAIWWLNASAIRTRLVPHREVLARRVDELRDRDEAAPDLVAKHAEEGDE
jgi:hypothetical protein